MAESVERNVHHLLMATSEQLGRRHASDGIDPFGLPGSGMMSSMRTLQDSSLLTVGYEGRTASELVEVLVEAGVDVLVDVRLTPLSRKPGLSKRALADALTSAGLEYLHLPALGNPRENRDGFRRGDLSSRESFRALLQSPSAQVALAEVRARVRGQRVALLCFEQDASSCHRQLVSDHLVSCDRDLDVHHL